MKIIMLITALVLSCGDALASKMSCTKWDTSNTPRFKRCENSEVICYYASNSWSEEAGLSCKWK